MKKQSGFTLIELLLVLAIIGIISAIAIPSFLSQRSRARDKSAVDNTVGRVGDLIGQYDKFHEKGLTSAQIVASLNNYLNSTTGKDKNPWNAAAPAYGGITAVTGNATKSAFEAAMVVGSLGQAKMYVQVPGSAGIGFMGGAVKVANSINGSFQVKKSAAIE